MYPKKLGISITIILLLAACSPSSTATPPVVTSTPSGKSSAVTPASETITPKKTKLPPNAQSVQSAPETATEGIAPYPDAPLCPDSGEAHDHSLFHTLWDSTRGCHYDHEHGQDPLTPEVADTFPGMDLRALSGEAGIGHTNPSSPKENTQKHGGFKWQVLLDHPHGCEG